MVQAFPRGGSLGGENKKRKSVDQLKSVAEDENLFKSGVKKQKKVVRKKKDGVLPGLTSGKKRPRGEEEHLRNRKNSESVYKLRFKDLRKGNLLYGIVKQIGEFHAVVSLANNLTGIVSVERVGDDVSISRNLRMSDFLEIGQYVRCVVFSVSRQDDGSQRIELSLQATLVNQNLTIQDIKKGSLICGSVKSLEDHGYVINLGIGKATGFLPYNIAGGSSEKPKLKLGQPIEAVVLNGMNPFKLSTNTDEVNAAISSRGSYSIASFQPGTLVEVKVEKVLSNGLRVRFLNDFVGTVEIAHLDSIAGPDWFAKYNEHANNATYKARVLYAYPENKGIGLSIAPHIVMRENVLLQLDGLKGKVFPEAKVVRVVPKTGLVLKFEQTSAIGYLPVSQIEEATKTNLAKNFEIGSSVKCRCLNFSAVDKTLHVSALETIIKAQILTHGDLQTGMDINATVVRVGEFGIIANVGNGIKAVIPKMHLSDVTVNEPERRFRVGQILKAKVLRVEEGPAGNKVQLTLKKSLIHSELPLLKSIEDAGVGVVAHGFVTSVHPSQGIHVSFFGDVHGLIYSSDLKAFGISSPEISYKKGEVVKVRIVDRQGPRLRLSLRTKLSPEMEISGAAGDDNDSLAPGRFVSGTILRRIDNNLLIRLDMPDSESESRALLPMTHLTDHPTLCEELLNMNYNPGKKLDKLLVLEKARKRTRRSLSGKELRTQDTQISPLTVSLKPKLIFEAENGNLPGSLTDVHEERIVTGYVSKLGPLGVFVKFINGLTALAPRANISDEWVNDPSQHFSVGQTVQAQVVHVNEKLNKFIVTLKASALKSSFPQPVDQLFLRSFLAEQEIIANAKTKRNKKRNKLASSGVVTWNIGQVCTATVLQLKEYGLIMELEKDGSVGFCMSENAPTELPKVGSKVECRILDIEPSKGIIDVTLRPAIVKAGKKTASSKNIFNKTDEKTEFKAVVEIVKTSHAVVSLPELKHALALVSLKDYNGKIPGFGGLRVGLNCSAVPIFREKEGTRVPEEHKGTPIMHIVSDYQMGQKKVRARSESYSSERVELAVGSIVRIQVRDIKKTNMIVTLLNVKKKKKYNSCIAKVHCSNVIDPSSLTGVASSESVFAAYSVGSILEAKVLDISKVKGNNKSQYEVSMSVRPSEINGDNGKVINRNEITWENVESWELSKPVVGYVNKITEDGIIVDLSRSVRGLIFCTNISKDLEVLEKLFNNVKSENADRFQVGSPVLVRIVVCDPESRHLDLVPVD